MTNNMTKTLSAPLWMFFICIKLSVDACFCYEYVGCYVDKQKPKRALPLFELIYDDTMSNEKCALHCCSQSTTITFFGTEYSNECYCGNQKDKSLFVSASWYDCNMPCAGNNLQVCGGPWRLSICQINCSLYRTTTNNNQTTTDTTLTTITGQTIPGFVKDELNLKIIQIRNEISVDKKTTSSYLNKKRSAPDHRSSSKAIGIVGIIVIAIPPMLIIICDVCVCFVCNRK